MMHDVKQSKLMEELLKVSQSLPKVGQIVSGKIIEINRNNIFIDLGSFGIGIILLKEIRENPEILKELKIGQEVNCLVLEPENEKGYIELSLKEANKELSWESLEKAKKDEQTLLAKVIQANRGGLLVEVLGISGFVPVSQLAARHYPRVENGDKSKILQELNKFIGQELKVKIIDLDPKDQLLILSEKILDQEEIKKNLEYFKIGEVFEGVVSAITDFGAFVKITPKKADILETEGLIHISELDWQIVEDPRQILKIGDKIKVKVIGYQPDRLALSLKALKKDPWQNLDKKYKKDEIISGRVVKSTSYGFLVEIEKGVYGLIGSFQPKTKDLKIGEKYQFKILSFEPKLHKMGLQLYDEKSY